MPQSEERRMRALLFIMRDCYDLIRFALDIIEQDGEVDWDSRIKMLQVSVDDMRHFSRVYRGMDEAPASSSASMN